MQKLDLDTLMNDELGQEEQQPEQKTDFVGMPLRDRPNTLDETIQDAKELPFAIADFAAAMLPGAGVSEAVGTGVENPVSSALGKEEAMPIPSLKKDVEEGNYLDAGLKTLGAAGDALTVAGAGMALTGVGSAPGAAMMATGMAAKGIAKYGDDVAKSLAKLFEVDEEAAKVAAKRIDDFAEQDKPVGAATSMLKAEIKKARPKQTVEAKPRATAPTDELGLYSRAEEAVADIDIPEEGIRADALMSKLKNKTDKYALDEIDFTIGMMRSPDAILTKADIDELFTKKFGIKETVLEGDDTIYGGQDLLNFRLPDDDGTRYREHIFQLRNSPAAEYDEKHHFRELPEVGKNQIGHMRTSIRSTADGNKVLVVEEIQADAFKRGDYVGSAADLDVPFKTNEGYVNMMLARAMRLAAEEGLDGVAVLNAAEQVRRNRKGFDGVVDKMESFTQNLPDGSSLNYKRVALTMKDKSIINLIVDNKDGKGKVVQSAFSEQLEGKTLAEVIGSKKTAEALLEKDQVVDGKDRVIGADGYGKIYDNVIPKRLNQMVKRMDADGKVDETTIEVSELNEYIKQEIDEAAFAEDYFMHPTKRDLIQNDLADETAEGFVHSRIVKNGLDEWEEQASTDFIDERGDFYDDLGPLSTVYDTFEYAAFQLRGNMYQQRQLADQLRLMYPNRFPEIEDAEDWLADYLDGFYNGPARYFTERLAEKKNAAAGKRSLQNSNQVLFTPEMKAEILGRGLPRLRTGGLVGKK